MNFNKLFLFVLMCIIPALSTALVLTNKIVTSKSVKIADSKSRKMIRIAHEKIYNPTFDDLVVLDRAVVIGNDLTYNLYVGSSAVACIGLCLDCVKEKKIWKNIALYSSMLVVGSLVAHKKINSLRRTYDLPPRRPIVEKA